MPWPVLLALAVAASPKTPEWSKSTLKTLLGRVQAAARAQTVQAKDEALANVGGEAYGVSRRTSESNEAYAKRVLRGREPDHPNVKQGQWLSALMRMFYEDVAARADRLARFETNRSDRIYLERMAKEAKQVAGQIAGTLQMVVEGLEGFVEPLPIASGEEPEPRGAMAMVHQGKITIENLDRITFVRHQPPENAPRTARGALKEVYSAQKQYNVSAQMLGRYERKWRRNRGHVRVVVPAGYPAVYLNEIVRGGIEAGMKTAHVLTMTKRGDLQDLVVPLRRAKTHEGKKRQRKKGRRGKQEVQVSCEDQSSMQACARKIAHARTLGRAVYVVR